MPLQVDADGVAQVKTHLGEFSDRAKDARPAMRKVRSIMEEGQRRNFETSGGYLGESWATLSPGTLARKARKGQDAKVLRATGALEASLTGGRGKRTGATKTMARVGTSVWYAVFAQSGTKTGPKRRVTGMTTRDITKSVRVIEKFVLTGEVF